MATKEEKRAARKQREAEEANRQDATGDGQSDGGTSDAVSASNVGASEAAAKASRASAEEQGDAGGPDNPDKTRPDDQTNVVDEPEAAGEKKSKKFDTVQRFLKLSGYEESDVIGHSDERRTVVTSNGGKYQISPSGKKLRKQSGPDTPKMVEEAAEEEEDRRRNS